MIAPPPPHTPWQQFYGAIHRLRRRWYGSRAGRLPRPVVSVGNLHWGGGGKTPLAAALAAHLRDSGRQVCILSRGYGSRGTGVRVVSTGEGPLLDPRVAGDEPVLLAGQLPGVAIVVHTDRYRAGLAALERLPSPPDLFLLDDGFSHLGLHRDVDLLAFPAADPFAGGRLFPSGRLREPLASSSRASAVLLTGAESGGAALAQALRPYGFQGPGFSSRTVSGEVALPAGTSVFLVSAVARPESFSARVRELGFPIRGELRFPDHHGYPAKSRQQIATDFRASGAAALLTTSKDRVKLGGLDLPLAELPIRAEPEPAFWRWLEEVLPR